MGEGEHRRRRIRGSRGAYVPTGDSPPVPSGREPVEPTPAGAEPGSVAAQPVAAQAAAAQPIAPQPATAQPATARSAKAECATPEPPPAKPTPASGRIRAMFGARPVPGPAPAPPATSPSGTSPLATSPGSMERTRPPARPGIERTAALDREPIDAHAVAPGSEDHERGLRGLIGGGASQVSVTAAMRARDAARPTAEDIAAAEASLTIVHRGWVPRDP